MEKFVIHEEWDMLYIKNDIGLIRVERDIVFNEIVKPVRLTKKNINSKGTLVLFAGWGSVSI